MTTYPGLQIVRSWLAEMHDQDIPYCHFKSNVRVLDGLEGITDLDIMVDRAGYSNTVELLSKCGFKRFQTSRLMDYPAVEDYLGCDQGTGKLVHLHLHWQMVVGEPNLKGYRLPWESLLFQGRKWEKNDIFIASHEHELLLLLTRAVLKLRFRDRLRMFLGRPYFKSGMKREFQWLLKRIDQDKFFSLAHEVYGHEIAGHLKELLVKPMVRDQDILFLSKKFLPVLQKYRTYSPPEALLKGWLREAYKLYSLVAKGFCQPVNVLRRAPSGGGLVIALLGVDGSGKSTHVKELVRWLGWKADVMAVYLGSGDGPRYLPRRVLDLAKPVIVLARRFFAVQGRQEPDSQGKAAAAPSKTVKDKPLSRQSFVRRVMKSVYALTLAREKRHKLRKAFRARNRGMIVITDRYPQNQVMGFNDGPLLNDLKNSSWPWSSFAEYEAKIYKNMVSLPPDLVIKLKVGPDVAMQRKTDTPQDMVLRKIRVVRELEFGQQTNAVSINASAPLEQVDLLVKQLLWEMI